MRLKKFRYDAIYEKGWRHMFNDLSDFYRKLTGKTVGILGIGVSNLPLLKMLLGIDCTITVRDKNPDEKTLSFLKENGIRVITEDAYLDNMTEDYLFRSPGIMASHPQIVEACERGCILTSEMEAFFDICPAKIIGITGSDGKTTTTTLIYEILKKAGYTCHLGGNIGHPLLADVPNIKADDIVIVELSSFQLMSMQKSADIAVITNLAPNHLDKHKDMEEYIEAKKNIFCHGKGITVFNQENEITKTFITEKSLSFSLHQTVKNGAYLLEDTIYFNGKEVMKRSDIRLPGIHNVDNYLAAICAVSTLCDLSIVKEVAQSFGGVEHRIEFVREVKGVRYYNDSIASSPTRAIAGLRSFDRKIIIIAGGSDKNIPFDGFAEEVVQRVKHLVVMGHTKEKIKTAVQQIAPNFSISDAVDLADAIHLAEKQAQPGDVIMLCPACASFDYFKNFMDRGNQFKTLVNQL